MIYNKEKLKTIDHLKDTLEMMNLCITKYRKTGEKSYLETARSFGSLSRDIRDFLETVDFTPTETERVVAKDMQMTLG